MTGDVTELRVRRDRGPFPSRYASRCDQCGKPIPTGQPVVLRHLWTGRIPLCQDCAA